MISEQKRMQRIGRLKRALDLGYLKKIDMPDGTATLIDGPKGHIEDLEAYLSGETELEVVSH